MKANVSELKARLSSYLRKVRRGETVIVFDRETPIARIIPFEDKTAVLQIEEPARPKSVLKKVKGVKPRRRIDVVKLLREDRDHR